MGHTPSPWTWWTRNSWRRLRHDNRGVSTNVLYPCIDKDGQADIDVSAADMALIAAAPEMLDALKAVVGEWDKLTKYGSPMVAKATNENLTTARAVIIKASTPWSP